MSKRAKKLSEVLRDALGSCEESTRAVGRATGVPHPCLSRFMRREQDLRLSSAEALMRYFRLGIVLPRPKTRPKPKRPNPRLGAAAKRQAGRGKGQ